MYGGKSGLAAGVAPAATLPFTGLNAAWLILAVITIFMTGLALVRLARG